MIHTETNMQTPSKFAASMISRCKITQYSLNGISKTNVISHQGKMIYNHAKYLASIYI